MIMMPIIIISSYPFIYGCVKRSHTIQ